MDQKRLMHPKLKIVNLTMASGIILANACFLPMSVSIILTGGGLWGLGLIALPLCLSANLFLIPALLAFQKKFTYSTALLIINTLGFLWSFPWFVIVMAWITI